MQRVSRKGRSLNLMTAHAKATVRAVMSLGWRVAILEGGRRGMVKMGERAMGEEQ